MNANTVKPSQLQTYFKAAMDKFIHDREGQEGSHLAAKERTTKSQERYIQDVEMESVESYRDRSGEHDQERKGLGALRRPQVATAGTARTGGFSVQRIRLSAMTDLNKFPEREQDEERARS